MLANSQSGLASFSLSLLAFTNDLHAQRREMPPRFPLIEYEMTLRANRR